MNIKKYNYKYIQKLAEECGISTIEKIYIDKKEKEGGMFLYRKRKTFTDEEFVKIEQLHKAKEDKISMISIVIFAIINLILITFYYLVLAGFLIEDFIPDLPF